MVSLQTSARPALPRIVGREEVLNPVKGTVYEWGQPCEACIAKNAASCFGKWPNRCYGCTKAKVRNGCKDKGRPFVATQDQVRTVNDYLEDERRKRKGGQAVGDEDDDEVEEVAPPTPARVPSQAPSTRRQDSAQPRTPSQVASSPSGTRAKATGSYPLQVETRGLPTGSGRGSSSTRGGTPVGPFSAGTLQGALPSGGGNFFTRVSTYTAPAMSSRVESGGSEESEAAARYEREMSPDAVKTPREIQLGGESMGLQAAIDENKKAGAALQARLDLVRGQKEVERMRRKYGEANQRK